MVWHRCMQKSHIVWANHTGFPFPTKLPFGVRWCEVDWKKKLIWNSDLVSLILLNFQVKKVSPPPNKTTTCWAVVSTEQGTSKSTSLPKPTANEASLVTMWLSVSLLKLLAMAVNQANAARWKTMLFPYQCNCLCWKIAMLDIALLDATMVLQAVSLRFCVPSENGVTHWGFCSIQCWAEIVHCRCDGNRDGSAISDQNWIKNRESAASRFTLPRLNWQINLWMNEPIFAPLLFASLSFLDSFLLLQLLHLLPPPPPPPPPPTPQGHTTGGGTDPLQADSMLPLKFQCT